MLHLLVAGKERMGTALSCCSFISALRYTVELGNPSGVQGRERLRWDGRRSLRIVTSSSVDGVAVGVSEYVKIETAGTAPSFYFV